MLRFLIRALLALLILVAAVFLSGQLIENGPPPTSEADAEPAVEVTVLPVSAGQWHPETVWTGEVVARDRVTITAPRSTEVLSVDVSTGESVGGGVRLLSLQRDDWERELAQARADIDDIRLSIELAEDQHDTNQSALALQRELLAQAERALERERNLGARGASTQAALEDAQSRVTQQRQAMLEVEARVRRFDQERAQLELQLERARRQLARLEDQGDRLTPEAPFAGRVSAVHVTADESVAAGAPLVELYARASRAWRVTIPAGADGLEAFLDGRWVPLDRRLATTGQSSGRPQGDFLLPDTMDWVPGETVSARVRQEALDNVQLIPSGALFEGDRVFLVNEQDRLEEQMVSQLGTTRVNGVSYLMIDAAALPDNGRILTTRLPDALTGLAVTVTNRMSQPAANGAQ